jgi:hypothetical protein
MNLKDENPLNFGGKKKKGSSETDIFTLKQDYGTKVYIYFYHCF